MTERRTCDYLRGMLVRGHDFKLYMILVLFLHKKSFFVSALYYVHVMLLLFLM